MHKQIHYTLKETKNSKKYYMTPLLSSKNKSY